MGYNSPDYTSLSKNTEMLLKIFNNLSTRYISPSYEKIRMKVDGLEKKYNQMAASKSYGTSSNKPLRQNQIGCINQLLNKLPEPNDKLDKNREDQARNILLGAIFYRFRQLEASYKPLKKPKSEPKPKPFWHYTNYTGFVGKLWTDDRSALCNLLDEEFHLRKELDHETIVTCCEAYLSFLKQPDKNFSEKQQIADQFPYIKDKDSKEEFFKKLEKVISVSKEFAQPVHRQLQFIGYVQSVAKALRENDIKVAEALKSLTNEVEKQLQKVESLSDKDLSKLLDSMKIEHVYKEQLRNALPLRVTKDGVLYEENYYAFSDYTSQVLAIKSRNVLLGAYVVALAHCTNEGYNNLRDTLNRGIDAVVNNQLDNNARKKGLDALTTYMEMKVPGQSPIDYSAWGPDSGEEKMRQALDKILNQVNESLGLKVVNQSLEKETKSEKTFSP